MPGRKPPPEPAVDPDGWRLTWGTHTWTENDLTGADIGALAQLLGNDFRQMMPSLGPLHLMSFLAVLDARATGDDFDTARRRIGAAKATDILGALTLDG